MPTDAGPFDVLLSREVSERDFKAITLCEFIAIPTLRVLILVCGLYIEYMNTYNSYVNPLDA